jgi:RNA polymerase sigma-70 factor, ECF subfamily
LQFARRARSIQQETFESLPAGHTFVVEERRVTSSASVLERSPDADTREPLSHASERTRSAPTERAQIEALIAKEYVGLRLLLTRRTGDPHVAAELLNDAICTTWEKWQANQIAHPEQIAGYVFQVAMNHWRNHRRSIAERPEKRADAKVLEALPQSEPGADEGIETHIAARVKELIRSMSSYRDRAVLVRFYLDEQDRDVICREMQMTPSQFAKVLHRARGRLRRLLEESGLKGSDLFCLALI